MFEAITYIREQSQPLQVTAPAVEPRLSQLAVKAVLFDIYGTLMVSGSGDIGVTQNHAAGQTNRGIAMAATLLHVYDYQPVPSAQANDHADLFPQLIAQSHAQGRATGHAHPEVNIIEIWQQLAQQLDLDTAQHLAEQAAVVYEVATNPVWPMPGLDECLSLLAQENLHLGIISNAQFYTPLLFPALLQQSLDDYGFASDLRWYSYQSKRAKPDLWMYEQARSSLLKQGIAADQVLYIGNDMLNDMWPAASVGFKTGLFAGDQRSLRLRSEHPQASLVKPDCVITNLHQIAGLIAKNE